MTAFADYKDSFETIKLERKDGIIVMTLHTDGGPMVWGRLPHQEITDACRAISQDSDNRVMILTGMGDMFSGPPATETVSGWQRAHSDHFEMTVTVGGMFFIMGMLDLPMPVISCINGPVYRHLEIPLLADIVLASETALIQETGHFINRLVPGDGVNLFIPLLLGWNRGRYFLLTGQQLNAMELQQLGLVNEVLPPDRVLPRAWELAEQLVQQSPQILRYTRLALTAPLKMLVQQSLGQSLALEGLGVIQDLAHRLEAAGAIG